MKPNFSRGLYGQFVFIEKNLENSMDFSHDVSLSGKNFFFYMYYCIVGLQRIFFFYMYKDYKFALCASLGEMGWG